MDDAQHSLEHCPAWSMERNELQQKLGLDLTFSVVIKSIVERSSCWEAFIKYCEKVMLKKERSERDSPT